MESLAHTRYSARGNAVVNHVENVPSEHDLVIRAQAGDRACFESLYRRTVGRTYAVCLRMCSNTALADDLCQEAYVRAWQKLTTFKGASSFATWLHRLTVNVVLSHFRSAARRDDENDLDLNECDSFGACRSATAKALDLEKAISSLPHRARTVFVLHDVEGYKHSEIAELAGMAVGTSKAHLNRARKLIREVLTS